MPGEIYCTVGKTVTELEHQATIVCSSENQSRQTDRRGSDAAALSGG